MILSVYCKYIFVEYFDFISRLSFKKVHLYVTLLFTIQNFGTMVSGLAAVAVAVATAAVATSTATALIEN